MSSVPERKRTFVDRQVQGALVKRMILHWLGFFLTASIVTFVLQTMSNPFVPIKTHFEELWWTQGPFLLVLIFLLPVFVLDTIKLSHRFAGPIYRLRRTMRAIADGEQPIRLKFRDYDFWHGLADDFNGMIDRLTQHSVAKTEEPTAEVANK